MHPFLIISEEKPSFPKCSFAQWFVICLGKSMCISKFNCFYNVFLPFPTDTKVLISDFLYYTQRMSDDFQ